MYPIMHSSRDDMAERREDRICPKRWARDHQRLGLRHFSPTHKKKTKIDKRYSGKHNRRQLTGDPKLWPSSWANVSWTSRAGRNCP